MNKKTLNKILKISIITFTAIVTCVLLVKRICFFDVLVVGDSMKYTLYQGEKGFALKKSFIGELKREDIVIFEKDNREIIKRVIGTPNDHVVITEEGVFVNNELIEETYVSNKNKEETFIKDSTMYNDVILQEDEYFVLGDNRSVSWDSRYFGPVNKKDITGKLKLIYARGDCTDDTCDKLVNGGFVPLKWF